METIDQIDDFHDQLAREYDEFRKKHPAFQGCNSAGINPAGASAALGLTSADVEAAMVNEGNEDEEVTFTKFGAIFCNCFVAVIFIFALTILIYAGYLWPPIFAIMFSVVLTCYIFERCYECMRRNPRATRKIDLSTCTYNFTEIK